MLEINYQKLIPGPFEIVHSQYYDYEHIEFVHPKSLGEYRLVSEKGAVIVYEQIWPRRWGRRARSVVKHTMIARGEMWFVFIDGRHKGVKVHTKLYDRGEDTLVDETYFMNVPNWGWLARVVRPFVLRAVNRVWDEDLAVEICHSGWPGAPEVGVPEAGVPEAGVPEAGSSE